MAGVVGPWPDPEIPDTDANGLMVPPWVKYPNLPKCSMGWRMGQGEWYRDGFRAWWNRQLRTTRQQVRATYPEPPDWKDFYKHL